MLGFDTAQPPQLGSADVKRSLSGVEG